MEAPPCGRSSRCIDDTFPLQGVEKLSFAGTEGTPRNNYGEGAVGRPRRHIAVLSFGICATATETSQNLGESVQSDPSIRKRLGKNPAV